MAEASEDAFSLLERDTTGLEVRARETDVVVPAGPVSHAVDHFGRRHLLIPLIETQTPLDDQSSRGVTVRTHVLVDSGSEHRYLDVTCELRELNDLFSVVCDEMLDRLSQDSSTPAQACRSVLTRWRELFASAPGPLLGRAELVGLLAELHLLELLAALSPERALRVWTGADKARFDFTGSTVAFEVKATTLRERMEIEVHGIRQLDPPSGLTLGLRIERMEPVPDGGDAVPDAIGRLRTAGVDGNGLVRALNLYGYSVADSDAYRKIRFRSLQERYYIVDGGFPRLVAGSLVDPTVLERVTQVNYRIDLTATPPLPIDDDARDRLFSELLVGGLA